MLSVLPKLACLPSCALNPPERDGSLDVPFRFDRDLLARLNLDHPLKQTLLLPTLSVDHLAPPHRPLLVRPLCLYLCLSFTSTILRVDLEFFALRQLREALRTTQDDVNAPLIIGHWHAVAQHERAERERMPIRHRRAATVRRRGPLLRKRAALACSAGALVFVGALGSACVANARGRVRAERAAEDVPGRDIPEDSRLGD